MVNKLEKRYGCPVEVTVEAIGGKWKSTILWWLRQSAKRPGELMQLIPGITQKVLTRQLRELEADGLIHRTSYRETPPRVEYSLTSQGETLNVITQLMCDWGKAKLPGFQFGLVELNDLNIVIVANDSAVREQLRIELGVIRGAQVITTSVATLLESIGQVQPDVIVVDIEASENSSVLSQQIQTLEAERENPTPLIALARQEDRSAAFAHGFRMVLIKPVEPAELAAAIASFTGRLG